ncbi:unnamed protein product [Mytilus edulis]|uniref:Uncharacterized protein n=1 Tax=Mytilus edulis TaxID=6550 RepID=A0A8S3PRV6_MYTED|nr:unnamed protein product [Mytilus edulis]
MLKKEILDLEMEHFDSNKLGVDGATEKLTKILQTIAENTLESTCSRFWITGIIITKGNADKLKANITGIQQTFPANTVVKLDCVNPLNRINGSGISRCLANGTWDEVPTCVLRPTLSQPATHQASIALYQYMCNHIVGTEEHVQSLRMINTVRDNLSRNEIQTTITSGSFGEGLDMRGSDVDLVKVISFIEVCENINIPFNQNITYFTMETCEAQPGSTQLRLVHEEEHFIASDSERAMSYNILGVVFKVLGDIESARYAFIRSIELESDPDLNTAFRNLLSIGGM